MIITLIDNINSILTNWKEYWWWLQLPWGRNS